jgi:D-lactate dehydrogenase
VDLVLGVGGTLKAEHGTGRIMAPYVRRQYGDELYEVMRGLKMLVDPAGILNPDAVLSDDPRSYLRDLKVAPPVESEVDRCVECGYCEPVCPSKDLTLTPRQRITLRRDVAAARAAGSDAIADAIMADYDYEGVKTCAADGMCQTACPVNINTGDLVRRLRTEAAATAAARPAWNAAARGWHGVTLAGAAALNVAKALPAAPLEAGSRLARKVMGDGLPEYDGRLPRGGHRRPKLNAANAEAVFFAVCIGTMFGPARRLPGRVHRRLRRFVPTRRRRPAYPAGPWRPLLRNPMEVQGLHAGLGRDAPQGAHLAAGGNRRRPPAGGRRRLLLRRRPDGHDAHC